MLVLETQFYEEMPSSTAQLYLHESIHQQLIVADPGGARGPGPSTPVKTSQKRWLLHGAASFASHWPSEKFLDLLLLEKR